MPARLFFRTKKLLKHFSKTFLLSLFLFITVLGNITPASAQNTQGSTQDTTYNEFYNLFDPTGQGATLETSAGMWKTPPEQTHANDLLLHFVGGFNFGANQGKDADWFWNHVKDFSRTVFGGSREDIFIVRLCQADSSGNPDETNCVFSDAPYASLCANKDSNGGTNPCTDTQLKEKIYHNAFVKSSGLLTAIENKTTSGFDVDMKSLDFHKLGNGNLGDKSNIVLQPGTSYVADLWYCAKASVAKEHSLPKLTQDFVLTHEKSDARIRNFNKLCGDQDQWPAYFRIAQTSAFKVPSTPGDAQNANQGGAAPSTGAGNSLNSGDFLPSCGWFNLTGGGTFLGCIAVGVFYVVYKPVSWFAGIMGNLFDFFLGYSISDESYRANFAVTGWRIVRDISNIFFIVILIWAGLVSVFNAESISLKKVVPAVIINALLINFSLFGTRVVIDLSNIVTRIFYNNVEVCAGKCEDTDGDGKPNNLKPGITSYKPLSEKILSSFNPQTLFSPQYLLPQNMIPQNGKGDSSLLFGAQSQNSQAQSGVLTDKNTEPDPVVFIIIALFAAVILFAIAVMFWNTAFLFLGRVIGLYVVMIFSPFAVLSRGNVPLVGNIENLKWSSWWKELSNYALLAPIFVFFLYVIYTFIDADWMKFTQIGSGSLLEKILGVGIPMLLIFMLIKQGVTIAKKYAGVIGNMVQGFVNKTVGGVGGLIGGSVGLAAGGVGLIGRNVLGRGIGLAGKIGTGRDKEGKRISLASRLASNADSNRFARMGNNFMKWSKTSTWDPRNISAKVAGKEYTALGTFNKGVTLLGKPIGEAGPKDNISGKLGMGKDAGKGGIKEIDKKRVEAKKKKINEKMNFDHLSDAEAKAAWQAHVEKKSLELAKPDAEHSFAMEHSGEYAKLQVQVESKQAELKTKGEEITKLYSEINDPSKSQAERDAKKNELRSKQNDFKNISGEIRKLKGKQSAELEKAKAADPDFENSTAYRNSLKTAQDKKRSEVDKYGKIENGKAFTNAMRAEYAEDLRKSSLWMWDDKKRWESQYGLAGGAAGNLLSGAAGLGLASWAAPFAAALGMYVQSEADIMDQATREIINATKKNRSVGSKKAKLENHHKALKKELEEHLKAVDSKMGGKKDIDEALEDDKFIEETLAARRIQMEQELKDHKKNFDAKDAAYKSETDPAKKDALKKTRDDAEIKLHMERAKYDRLSNLRNEVDRAEEAFDRYTAKEAEAEEKAKKKTEEGKGGGDKGDGKDAAK